MYHKIKVIFLSIHALACTFSCCSLKMGMAGNDSFKQKNLKEAANEVASADQLREAVFANHLEGVNRAINDHANVNMVLVNQWTALHIAAHFGYYDIVDALINAPNVNINARNEQGKSPLYLASMSGMEQSAQLLINAGADINASDNGQWTALHTAAGKGHHHIVDALIKAPNINLNVRNAHGYTPLYVAVDRGREQSARLLINAGADINISDNNQWTALHWAAYYGYIKIVDALIHVPNVNLNSRNEQGYTPLHVAVMSGMKESVRLLIEVGADINITNNNQWTALHRAAYYGYNNIVDMLIHTPHVNVNLRNEYGQTPLYVAVDRGREQSARLLIDAGADIKISNHKQRTALHLAASNGHSSIVGELIKVPHLNLNVRNENGQTPLHVAVINGMVASARLLIDAGADINIPDKYQQTALHLAAYFGYDDIVDSLIKRPNVNINSRDEDGDTPLHVAADNGRAASARLLIDAGADINRSDNQ